MAGVPRVTLLFFMNLQLIFTCHFHTPVAGEARKKLNP